MSLPTSAEPPNRNAFSQSREITTDEREALSHSVSLINLISTPEKYIGKLVAVEGFLHVQYEDERLYLTKEHAEHLIRANAVDVSFAKSNLLLQPASRKQILPRNRDHALYTFDKKYVLLIGRFTPGNLSEVTRVMEKMY